MHSPIRCSEILRQDLWAWAPGRTSQAVVPIQGTVPADKLFLTNLGWCCGKYCVLRLERERGDSSRAPGTHKGCSVEGTGQPLLDSDPGSIMHPLAALAKEGSPCRVGKEVPTHKQPRLKPNRICWGTAGGTEPLALFPPPLDSGLGVWLAQYHSPYNSQDHYPTSETPTLSCSLQQSSQNS